MRIGVVSDTHDNLTNVERILRVFESARVERVVHTGDITRARTLEMLGRLDVPVVGVYGNNDLERTALDAAAADRGLRFVDPPLSLTWSGRRILVVHDPSDHDTGALDRHDVLLHGHTHRCVIDRTHDRLTFNPGECAGMMEGYNAVGVLHLESLDVEIVYF